jgi:hypothetical protein
MLGGAVTEGGGGVLHFLLAVAFANAEDDAVEKFVDEAQELLFGVKFDGRDLKVLIAGVFIDDAFEELEFVDDLVERHAFVEALAAEVFVAAGKDFGVAFGEPVAEVGKQITGAGAELDVGEGFVVRNFGVSVDAFDGDACDGFPVGLDELDEACGAHG